MRPEIPRPEDDDKLSERERRIAERLGLPPTRAALTQALDRVGRLYAVVARLKEKYRIEAEDEQA